MQAHVIAPTQRLRYSLIGWLQADRLSGASTTCTKKIHNHQCTGGGLRKGGYIQPDHGSGPLLPWFLLAERFDQRGRSSPPPLAFSARWDSNHGVSPWIHTPHCLHCQLIAVPVRLTNYDTLAGLITCTRINKRFWLLSAEHHLHLMAAPGVCAYQLLPACLKKKLSTTSELAVG